MADMCQPLDDMLAGVSTRRSITMGDLLFTGDTAPGCALAPGMRLVATIAGRQVLDVKVKL